MVDAERLEATTADGCLFIAEQRVDRQARTELFRGREIELVTARVVLHALDDHGQPLCGHDPQQLTPIGQPWYPGYLPHLPRCRSCLAQVTDAPAPRLPRPGRWPACAL